MRTTTHLWLHTVVVTQHKHNTLKLEEEFWNMLGTYYSTDIWLHFCETSKLIMVQWNTVNYGPINRNKQRMSFLMKTFWPCSKARCQIGELWCLFDRNNRKNTVYCSTFIWCLLSVIVWETGGKKCRWITLKYEVGGDWRSWVIWGWETVTEATALCLEGEGWYRAPFIPAPWSKFFE